MNRRDGGALWWWLPSCGGGLHPLGVWRGADPAFLYAPSAVPPQQRRPATALDCKVGGLTPRGQGEALFSPPPITASTRPPQRRWRRRPSVTTAVVTLRGGRPTAAPPPPAGVRAPPAAPAVGGLTLARSASTAVSPCVRRKSGENAGAGDHAYVLHAARRGIHAPQCVPWRRSRAALPARRWKRGTHG